MRPRCLTIDQLSARSSSRSPAEGLCWLRDRPRWTVCECSRSCSRGSPMVVLQQATEPLTRHNRPIALRQDDERQNQLVAQSLMVPFVMVMRNELAHGPPERSSPTRIRRSRHDSLMLRTKRSANALRFGERGGSRTGSTPALANVSRNAAVKSGSRSWIRKRLPSGSHRWHR